MTRVNPRLKEPQVTRPARGHIDNSLSFVIFLVLVAIAGWNYLDPDGIKPADLWDRVPELWKTLLAFTGVFIVAGLAILFAAVRLDDGREPFRAETRGSGRIIHETAIAMRTAGMLLFVFGAVLLGFGAVGAGWVSWVVLALGLVLALSAMPIAYVGKRFVVERELLAAESRRLASWSRGWSCSWDEARRPLLEVTSTRSGGAFGQPLVEQHAVMADGHEIYSAPYRDKADKLVALLQEAIAETGA